MIHSHRLPSNRRHPLRSRRTLFGGLTALCLLLASSAAQAQYLFTQIATAPSGRLLYFANFSFNPNVAINSAGLVAYAAFYSIPNPSTEHPGDTTLEVGNGTTNTIRDTQNSRYNFLGVSINTSGNITTVLNLRAAADLRVNASSIPLPPPLSGNVFALPTINDSNLVAFYGGGPSSGIYTTTLAGSVTPILGSTSASSFTSPSINNSGAVAYAATLTPGGAGIYRTFSGSRTVIANAASGLSAFGLAAINSAGQVAFSATATSGLKGIYVGDGTTLSLVADTSGAYAGFPHADTNGVAINNLGQVAFQADRQGGGSGIYVGPDALRDKVIATGDPLFGSTVTSLYFQRGGLNDSGQLAFLAGLADGRQVIVRASVPAVASVSGTLTLQGCVNSVQPMTFVFRPTDGSAPLTRTATLDATGAFSLSDLPRNSYNVWIKGAKWLAKVVPVDTTLGDVTGVTATLLAGDANNDNAITTADYLLLKASFGATPADPNWNNGAADFNCDGVVSTADYLLLKANFGLQGDL